MGSVLSQEEVDALLQGVTSDEEVSEEDEEEYDPEEVVSFDLT
ncbi:MAG TPA: flagellar motor switch protein FliM, partial [Candidatus Lambdaproteobacteria bacterium]|nr:flagellar motor switch protein FliM [Candidatus Lambdaproteobacteria bacterium]